MLPDREFSVNRTMVSGLQSRCKECNSEDNRRYRQGRLEQDRDDVTAAEPDVDPASEEPHVKRPRMEPEHLYIMALSIDPTGAVYGFKVGRSGDVQQRANSLAESMPFTMVVLAIFPGAGHVEKRVHSLLEHRRNPGGSGREWFHNSLSVVIQYVGVAMEAGVGDA